jgi:hypothetical protein
LLYLEDQRPTACPFASFFHHARTPSRSLSVIKEDRNPLRFTYPRIIEERKKEKKKKKKKKPPDPAHDLGSQ